MSEETFGNWIKIMNKTLNYYNENAQSFASGTVSVEFTEMQDKFLQKLNPGAYILDFGCGAGRDTKYFLDQGYLVEAIDGSEQLCQIASKHTGIKVRQEFLGMMKCQDIQGLVFFKEKMKKYILQDVYQVQQVRRVLEVECG